MRLPGAWHPAEGRPEGQLLFTPSIFRSRAATGPATAAPGMSAPPGAG